MNLYPIIVIETIRIESPAHRFAGRTYLVNKAETEAHVEIAVQAEAQRLTDAGYSGILKVFSYTPTRFATAFFATQPPTPYLSSHS